MTEKEQKIFDLQPESTKRAILRQMNFESNSDPWPPQNWLAVPDAKTMEERVGARAFTFDEMKVEEGLRQKRGQYIAEMNEDSLPVMDQGKRLSAISAFMTATKGSIKERFVSFMEVMGLVDKVKK